ncbi:MAG TPA: methane monooxygenase/ammonia monooxygenase subunit A [Pseudomonadales bacterium]
MSIYLGDKNADPQEEREVGSAVKTYAEQLQTFKSIDYALGPFLIFLLGAVFSFQFALTVGDWDYWADWRDRRWWPLVTPLSLAILPAVFGYFFWERLRLPLAGTMSILGLMFAAWVSRYFNFNMFAGFPMNFVAPSTYIAMGIVIDTVMLVTRSYALTGAIGGFIFAVIIYPLNWPMMAPMRVPIEYNGTMVTVADLMGYEYVRTAIPEYVRIIEESTLRTFGEAVTPLTAVFAGFVTILWWYLWTWIGSLLGKPRWVSKII